MNEKQINDVLNVFSLDDAADQFAGALKEGVATGRLPKQLKVDPESVEQDLVRLVLTLVEFVRQLMEAQAVRRMENGSLTEEQEEQLGLTLWRAREKILELAADLDIDPKTLTLDLGPLGRLV